VIGSSQRPLPNNTQHSEQTDIHKPVGFELTIPASERTQTHALDGADAGTGALQLIVMNSSPVGCETVSFGECLPTAGRALRFFLTSGTTHRMARRHIPDLRPSRHRSEKLKRNKDSLGRPQ